MRYEDAESIKLAQDRI